MSPNPIVEMVVRLKYKNKGKISGIEVGAGELPKLNACGCSEKSRP
jgi:hypothetical protein